MEKKKEFDGILFIDTLQKYQDIRYTGRVIHILCRQGSMSFTLHNIRYNITAGDYVILPNGTVVAGFLESDDFCGIIMSLSESFIASIAIRSNYGIIGHLSLLQNPVMKLSPYDFRKCEEDMERLRQRTNDEKHLFREEMLGSLLTAHILDLYDIHARR